MSLLPFVFLVDAPSALNAAAWVLLAVAIIGSVSSFVFLVLALVGARYHQSKSSHEAWSTPGYVPSLPPVSVLKPIHGLEPGLRDNLETFFRQDYPDYEILFAAAENDDPALAVIAELCGQYPQVNVTTLVTGHPPWPNPPAYAFYRMEEISRHPLLITSDSDVSVSSDYLRKLVAPLLDQSIGMVTCVYRGRSLGGFWSDLDAIGMSVEMTAGVVVANMLEGMKFGLGPTIAVRKDALSKIGGYAATGNYFSNDFIIGNLIEKSGYRIVLSDHVIEHVVPPMTFRRMWDREVRWAKGTRYSRPWGHLGTGLVFAMPYGILGFAAATLLGFPKLGELLLGVAILNRLSESWAIGWKVVADPQARKAAWLYPVRDLLGFAVWCASYLSRRTVWRDNRYQLVEGGKIVERQSRKDST